MSTRTETIICPKCEHEQKAEIQFEDWMPFPCYVHECTNCGYIITESEWEPVRTVPTPEGGNNHG